MANLNKEAFVLVQQDGRNYKATLNTLGDIVAVIDADTSGVTAGDVLRYNGNKWVAETEIVTALVYHGTLSGDDTQPDGTESAGHFYLIDEALTLPSDNWPGIDEDTDVVPSDMVLLQRDGNWNVTSGQITGAGVNEIISTTPALEVDAENASEPRLSISDATESESGLMSNEDKTRLNNSPDIIASEIAPGEDDSKAGDLWFDTNDGTLAYKHTDGDNSYWVGISSDSTATAPVASKTYVDTKIAELLTRIQALEGN